MPIERREFLVAFCPNCGSAVSCGGENEFDVWQKRKDIVEALQGTDGATLEEKIANSCTRAECGREYGHRRCARKPCGYCRSKRDSKE